MLDHPACRLRHGRAVAWRLALAALLAPAALVAQTRDIAESRRLGRDAVAAYRAGDFAAFEAKGDSALHLRPDHPSLVYNLAAARALNGDAPGALSLLGRLADWGLSYDPARDDDFASLRGEPGFDAVRGRLLANGEPHGDAEPAYELGPEQWVPEALAYDPVGDCLYLGGVRERTITRVARDGSTAAFAGGAGSGQPAPLGMVVDPRRRVLWVSGTTMPESASRDDGQAETEVRAYDLGTGRLLHTHRPAPADSGMALGDLTLDGRGGVLVSDGRTGALLLADPDSPGLDRVLPRGTLGSPQGIVLEPDGRHAFVADYALGLVRVDIENGTARPLAAPTTLLGSDALLRIGDDLLVVQNGITPARVMRIRLSADRERIDDATVLVSGLPSFQEPTGAVLARGSLFLVANGQWARFADGRPADPRTVAAPLVLRVALTAPPGSPPR